MEDEQNYAERPEDKPGYGVDRAQIREMLALTPAERLETMVVAVRNMATLLEKMRIR